ncbi:hypothetical protein IMG5_147730 [Ichthyophthirius multifiliis]|uniref:Eukaryotic translation initiation factor 3 30 kDa subunit n=1 Tax=Ichthyophthirius multifiliis TaxID=5932 RepID=G0QY70_ICHMU|nr:hypothetical protein IMG5_147730 [Ichthyophthirius multifiliis]EGR29844.1 hypothetical protein IMG5_147730 [Ichthyophthirius multifiliis]|eukprot:XP_004031080.1 hypothetical protein IMG5_147730 [Ichthyophthirius multifiliis]
MEDWEALDQVDVSEIKVPVKVEDAVFAKKEEKPAQPQQQQKEGKNETQQEKKKAFTGKTIQSNDLFNQPDNSKTKTKLLEKKNNSQAIKDLFEGAISEHAQALDNIQLKNIQEFELFGQLLGNKLSDPDYYLIHVEKFFESFLDGIYDKLTSKEFQAISTKVNVLLTKKQKEEKTGPKKVKAKGPTVVASKNKIAKNLEARGSDESSQDDYNYKANFNEDDFM